MQAGWGPNATFWSWSSLTIWDIDERNTNQIHCRHATPRNSLKKWMIRHGFVDFSSSVDFQVASAFQPNLLLLFSVLKAFAIGYKNQNWALLLRHNVAPEKTQKCGNSDITCFSSS
jgi:hypothetical protein